MSFLQRLKGRGVRTEQRLQSSEEETALDKIVQLDVDVFQTTDLIVVYAQAAGAELSDIHVSIEGDADVVLIEGSVFDQYISRLQRQNQTAPFLPRSVCGGIFTDALFYLRVWIL
jgi:HSP20 family molecular chaperone IbpA